jgi:hypothetical protein
MCSKVGAVEVIEALLVVDDVVALTVQLGNNLGLRPALDVAIVDRTLASR